MKDIAEAFREFVSEKIAEQNLSLREIERRTGLSISTTSRLINNKCTPDLRTVQKLLDGLGYDIIDFVDEKMRES